MTKITKEEWIVGILISIVILFLIGSVPIPDKKQQIDWVPQFYNNHLDDWAIWESDKEIKCNMLNIFEEGSYRVKVYPNGHCEWEELHKPPKK